MIGEIEYVQFRDAAGGNCPARMGIPYLAKNDGVYLVAPRQVFEQRRRT
jgi:hypothetical protein